MEMRTLTLTAAAVAIAAWGSEKLLPYPATEYRAELNGIMETPPNQSRATGTATLTLLGNELQYKIIVHGLSGAATAAHVHVGQAGSSGGPVVMLTVDKRADGTIADDSVDLAKGGSSIPVDSLKSLLDKGGTYVNVHTAQFPGGEIRGQLVKH